MQWEVVIGLETHVQLSTKSKIFSGSARQFGDAPNVNASALDLAMPGTLPVLNYGAVEKAITFGLAISATVAQTSVFDRKSYFYPDLPHGYQISQFEHPVVIGGQLSFLVEPKHGDNYVKTINLTRAHLEEDAGKSVHGILPGASGMDLNRAGTPLLEIVTEPEMRSSAEAVAYAKSLHSLVVWLGVSDGNMQEGNFRCDANVSVRPVGQKELGTRCEIKNLNSFKFLQDAIDYEIRRQIELIEEGGKVVQATRLYDPEKNETRQMRTKEDSMDYRYFPDPDLLPLEISSEWIETIRNSMPELPQKIRDRLISDFSLPEVDANVLTASKEIAEYYLASAELVQDKKMVANWVMGEVSAALNQDGATFSQAKVSPSTLSNILNRLLDGTINQKGAKEVFSAIWSGETDTVDSIIEAKGLKQISDTGALEVIIDEVLANNQKSVEEFRSGKEKAFNALVGQCMKATRGKANPSQVNALLKAKLSH